jgi:predicted adenine nucleotide alpha hydrolase (AANH) superfamily ATPase
VHRKRFLINLAKELKKQPSLTETEKQIVQEIENYKNSFSQDFFGVIQKSKYRQVPVKQFSAPILVNKKKENLPPSKPGLLLHICCAPDLAWPLRWLKEYFKLYLFWYNPNIHPYKEYQKRYEQYIKLLDLEPGDYEVLEDRYEPKEFFQYLQKQYNKYKKNSFQTSSELSSDLLPLSQMEEKNSPRCWWCYELRLLEAAKMAERHNIPYFTTTLLISPKKDLTHLWEA